MMRCNGARLLLFSVLFASVPAANAQVAPSNQETPKSTTAQSERRFPAMRLKTHSIWTQSALRPAWEMRGGGELIVSNDSIEFRNPADAKASFALLVSDLRSLEKRRGPEGFRVLRLTSKNGKNFDLVPGVSTQQSPAEDTSVDTLQKAMDENLSAMEKAVRDMATQHGVVLK